MASRSTTRTQTTVHPYDQIVAMLDERINRSQTGRIVIKAKDRPRTQSRQDFSRRYVYAVSGEGVVDDTALQDWLVFSQLISTNSGSHVHQGGLALHVLKGKGHTMLNGVRVDWKEGDLVLMPVLPGGIEHQHFNDNPDGPSEWLATIYLPFWYILCSELRQVSKHPDYKEISNPHA
jgi:gentisate 1,2-dioxygenase